MTAIGTGGAPFNGGPRLNRADRMIYEDVELRWCCRSLPDGRERSDDMAAGDGGRCDAHYFETDTAPVLASTLIGLVVAPLVPGSNCTSHTRGSIVDVSPADL